MAFTENLCGDRSVMSWAQTEWRISSNKTSPNCKKTSEVLPFSANLVNTWSTLYRIYPPVYLRLLLVTSVPTSNAKYLILLLLLFTSCYLEFISYCNGIQEVRGSIPLSSTKGNQGVSRLWTDFFLRNRGLCSNCAHLPQKICTTLRVVLMVAES
jgi:hypothetical protein